MISCIIDGCSDKAIGRRLCKRHYQLLGRRGEDRPPTVRAQNKGRSCSIEGCERPAKIQGLCFLHDGRKRRLGSPHLPVRIHKPTAGSCEVDGCDGVRTAGGLCQMHYERRRRTGDVGPAGKLFAPDGTGSLSEQGYYRVMVKGRRYSVHRRVMSRVLGRELTPDENVHHKDGDRANNDPANLELWNTGQPPGQRVADKVQWALTLLKRYPEFADGYRLIALESREATQELGKPAFNDFDAREVIRGLMSMAT